VRVKPRPFLEEFQRESKFQHLISNEQLEAAGTTDTIKGAGVHRDGYALLELTGTPGMWHEECLEWVAEQEPEFRLIALQVELLKEVDSANLDNLECPKCGHCAVSAWFTNPAPEKYRTWLICSDCDFWTHVINSTRPSSFSESRVRPDLQEKDAAILKAMRSRKE
jgi:hypothetical protein